MGYGAAMSVQRNYCVKGKKGKRHIPYRQLSVREHDWYNVHSLADKFELTIADTIGILVAKNLEALNVKPLTAHNLLDLEIGQVTIASPS